MEFGQQYDLDFFDRMLVFTANESGIQAYTPTALKACREVWLDIVSASNTT